MKNNKFLLVLPILLTAKLWAGESNHDSKYPQGVLGTTLALKVDFDIYKIRHGDKKPYIYSYIIMPGPEVGIGGRNYTYLGRMPSGTVLEIVSFGDSKVQRGGEYQAKPLSPINDKIKRNTLRKAHEVEENLDEQSFKLRGMAQGLKVYTKEKYSNGAPTLNETWFKIINMKE